MDRGKKGCQFTSGGRNYAGGREDPDVTRKKRKTTGSKRNTVRIVVKEASWSRKKGGRT